MRYNIPIDRVTLFQIGKKWRSNEQQRRRPFMIENIQKHWTGHYEAILNGRNQQENDQHYERARDEFESDDDDDFSERPFHVL